jgi:hypothetical protein
VEVVGQERNSAICERVSAVESSSFGAELGSVLEMNRVDSVGENIVALDF